MIPNRAVHPLSTELPWLQGEFYVIGSKIRVEVGLILRMWTVVSRFKNEEKKMYIMSKGKIKYDYVSKSNCGVI